MIVVAAAVAITVDALFIAAVTVMDVVPVAALYSEELILSGAYATVSTSVPAVSEPAGMLIVATPPLSVTAVDAKPPPVSVTEPVGVALPLFPLTAIATVMPWAVVMVVADGVIVTSGAVCGWVSIDTATELDVPPPGAGVVTCTLSWPTVVISEANTWAVSDVLLT